MVAMARAARLPCGRLWSASLSSSSPLAATAGMDSRNENRAAVSRVSPANRPAMIVEPERLEPGISASTCAPPIASPSPIPRSSIPRLFLPTNSAIANSSATTIIIVAITQRFFVNVPSICFLNSRPTRPTGMEPIITSQPSNAS